MAARMKTGATYEDLVRLPENMVGELMPPMRGSISTRAIVPVGVAKRNLPAQRGCCSSLPPR
jgi:hypothetical protein